MPTDRASLSRRDAAPAHVPRDPADIGESEGTPLADPRPPTFHPRDATVPRTLNRSRPEVAVRAPRTPARLAERWSRVERRRQRRMRWGRRLVSLDAACLALAAAGSAYGASRANEAVEGLEWILLYSALTIGFIAARGGYRLRLEVSPLEYVGKVLAATATAAMCVIATRVLVDPEPAVAQQAVRLWGFATVYLLGARLAIGLNVYRAERKGLPTLIVGAGHIGQTVARRLLERPAMGLRPVGYLDKEPRDAESDEYGIPVLGASWELEHAVRELDVEHVIITFSTAPNDVLLSIVRRCRALGVEVSVVPRLFEEMSSRVDVRHLGGIPFLSADQSDPRGWQFEVKYGVDRVGAAIVLLLMSPLLAAITLLIKLSSPGPIFFRQPRIGLDGREFDILKFRTMRIDPDAQENDAAWAAKTLGGATEEQDDAAADPVVVDRRTPVGRVLRRWSLDELPQILNILRGEMSFIGPRPERTGYVRAFEQHVYRYGDRHRVKSGLTGWAQVHGLRGETSLRDRVEWDNYYVENWSPWLDMKILLLTLPAVLEGRGAQ